jgi:hypothetical protein
LKDVEVIFLDLKDFLDVDLLLMLVEIRLQAVKDMTLRLVFLKHFPDAADTLAAGSRVLETLHCICVNCEIIVF